MSRTKVLDLLNSFDRENNILGIALYLKLDNESRKVLKYNFITTYIKLYKVYPVVGSLKKEGYERER